MVEAARALERRKPGGMQDFVGVSVTDAAEDTRIGQRPLECVGVALQSRRELRGLAGKRVDASGIVFVQPVGAANQMQGRAFLLARLGHDQRAVLEIERGEAQFGRQLCTRIAPAQSPRDHQVQHQEQVALELEHNPLAESAQTRHAASLRVSDRRLDGAKQERATESHALQHA